MGGLFYALNFCPSTYTITDGTGLDNLHKKSAITKVKAGLPFYWDFGIVVEYENIYIVSTSDNPMLSKKWIH